MTLAIPVHFVEEIQIGCGKSSIPMLVELKFGFFSLNLMYRQPRTNPKVGIFQLCICRKFDVIVRGTIGNQYVSVVVWL